MLTLQISDPIHSANHHVALSILVIIGVVYGLYRVCSLQNSWQIGVNQLLVVNIDRHSED